MKRAALVTVVLTTLAACGASNSDLRTRLDTRAKFDLNCPKVDLVPLETDTGLVRSYGVTGCGRRATYVLSGGNTDWYMNSSDSHAVSPVPADAPPVPQQ
ncbi:MAG: hypothetical protein ABUL62_22140 [Myxococcales bacterium]